MFPHVESAGAPKALATTPHPCMNEYGGGRWGASSHTGFLWHFWLSDDVYVVRWAPRGGGVRVGAETRAPRRRRIPPAHFAWRGGSVAPSIVPFLESANPHQVPTQARGWH